MPVPGNLLAGSEWIVNLKDSSCSHKGEKQAKVLLVFFFHVCVCVCVCFPAIFRVMPYSTRKLKVASNAPVVPY